MNCEHKVGVQGFHFSFLQDEETESNLTFKTFSLNKHNVILMSISVVKKKAHFLRLRKYTSEMLVIIKLDMALQVLQIPPVPKFIKSVQWL